MEGLLLKKLSVLIATCPTFPFLNIIQKANFAYLVRQMSTSAVKAKSDLIAVLNEISTKLGTFAVTVEQEPVLERLITEYDTSLICAHERVAIFYEVIRDKLVPTGIDISPLLDLSHVPIEIRNLLKKDSHFFKFDFFCHCRIKS